MTNPRQLSLELRRGNTPHLTRRRWIIALSFFGVIMGKIVALYQTGILRRLPDPPIPVFNSTKVDASNYAYKRLDTPDAFLMVASYAITAALAGAGSMHRERRQPLLPLALTAKAAADVGTALLLTKEEWQENRALCFYCNLALLASVGTLILSLPETADAIKNLQNPPSKPLAMLDDTIARMEAEKLSRLERVAMSAATPERM